MKHIAVIAALFVVASVHPAAAQETTAAPCAATALAAPWSAWGGSSTSIKADRALEVGKTYALELHPSSADNPGFGDELLFTVKSAGTFRFALGGASWIDIVSGDVMLKPIAFGHGPECSGIRKIVTFELAPGSYTVRITKSKIAALKLLIVAG